MGSIDEKILVIFNNIPWFNNNDFFKVCILVWFLWGDMLLILSMAPYHSSLKCFEVIIWVVLSNICPFLCLLQLSVDV